MSGHLGELHICCIKYLWFSECDNTWIHQEIHKYYFNVYMVHYNYIRIRLGFSLFLSTSAIWDYDKITGFSKIKQNKPSKKGTIRILAYKTIEHFRQQLDNNKSSTFYPLQN